jgi:hypothetical protein
LSKISSGAKRPPLYAKMSCCCPGIPTFIVTVKTAHKLIYLNYE